MSDRDFSFDSFSVDDILKEVAALRSSEKADLPPVAQNLRANALTKQEINSDRESPNSAEKTADNQQNNPRLADEQTAKTAGGPEELFDGSDMSKMQFMHSHKPKTITKDEINSGIQSEPLHINQKRRPKVITPEELRSQNSDNSQDALAQQADSLDDTVVFKKAGGSVRLEDIADDKKADDIEDSNDKVKRQIDALFNSEPAPAHNNIADTAADTADGSTTVFEPVKKAEPEPKKLTRAERREHRRAEKEEKTQERISRDEQKAAEEIEKHLSKSRAADVKAPSDIVKDNTPKDDDITVGIDENINADSVEISSSSENIGKNSDNNIISSEFMAKSEPDADDFDQTPFTAGFGETAVDEPAENTNKKRNFRPIRPAVLEIDKLKSDDGENSEIDDYRSIEDAESVRAGLDHKSGALAKRAFFTFVWFILSGLITLLPIVGVSLPSFISPGSSINVFLTANIAVLILAILTNGKTAVNGLVSLIKLRPDIDSAVSISALTAILQSALAFNNPQSFVNGTGYLYSSAAILAMFFNVIGKKSMFARVRSNFDLVATTGIKQSCFALKDKQSASVTDGRAAEGTTVACSRSVLNLHDYLYNSFCEDPADRISMISAPVGLLSAAVTAIIVYLLKKDIMSALGALSAVAAVSVPLTAILAANLPIKRAGKNAKLYGGLISGYNAVESFADTEYAVINDYELFPSGSVDLLNLKATGDNSIDDVMMDAAALVLSSGSPLGDVFDRMIGGRVKNLKPVKDVVYTDGKGLCGTAGEDKMWVGNRALIEDIGDINLPDIEFERKIARNGCCAVYIARNDSLCGLLVVKYNNRESDLDVMLQDVADSGITLLVKTCDPNVTEQAVKRIFGLRDNEIYIMPSEAAEQYEQLTTPRESADSVIAYEKSPVGYLYALRSAKRLKTAVKLAVVLQTVGVVLGMAFAVFMCLSGGYTAVSPLRIIIYQLICSFITVVVPAIKRV